MLKRVIVATAALLVIGALGYLIWLNPSAVDFQFVREQTLRIPLGWLLVFAFAGGVAVAGLATIAQRLVSQVGSWRQRRRERVAGRVADWEQQGLALAWNGEIDRSRALLLKAWRRSPQNHGTALALASSYMDTGEFDRARMILEEAVTHDASDADVRYALSEALRRTGQLNDAIRMLETVRVQYPRAPRALVGLREMYREAGRWNEAADLQESLLEVLPLEQRAPERQRLLDFRYRAAVAADVPANRLHALRAIHSLDRAYIPAIASLAEALATNGEEQEATRLLDRAVRTTPCLALIERLLVLQKAPRERQRLLSRLRKQAADGDEAMRCLSARVALDEGNLDEAAAELEKISDQSQPAIHRLWAELHRQRGAVRDAFRSLSQFLDSDPARRDGIVCSLCQRVPSSGADRLPQCQFWDGIRTLGAG